MTLTIKKKCESSAHWSAPPKEMLIAPMHRAGIDRESDRATLAEAEALAEALADVTWQGFLGSFEPIATQYLAMYRRIGELNPQERVVVEALMAHQLALREFSRLELAGRGERSLDPIWALGQLP